MRDTIHRPLTLTAAGLAGLILLAAAPWAAAQGQAEYSVAELLSPCMEGDNDARWGSVAELECEQYIRGFLDAYGLTAGEGGNLCLPAPGPNRADQVRWAFMRWAHQHYDQRHRPAGEGLMATLRAQFACP